MLVLVLGKGEQVGVISFLGVRQDPWRGLGRGESRGLEE